MKDKDVKDRIYNFYTNPEIINTLTSLSGWGNVGVWVGQGGREQALMDKDRYNELDNLGDNILSQGTNNNLEYPESEPERLKIHDDLHAELFQKLTKLQKVSFFLRSRYIILFVNPKGLLETIKIKLFTFNFRNILRL